MLEHIILHQLSTQLDDILSLSQHGFRSNISCTTQLITVFHDLVFNNDKGLEPLAVALDFSKAFDLVPHPILIQKLLKYDIDPVLISAFLTDRHQRVVLKGSVSSLVWCPLRLECPKAVSWAHCCFCYFLMTYPMWLNIPLLSYMQMMLLSAKFKNFKQFLMQPFLSYHRVVSNHSIV